MYVASRNPEGFPNGCPVCGSDLILEPSTHGDAPCPKCGLLLWLDSNNVFEFLVPEAYIADLGTSTKSEALARMVQSLVHAEAIAASDQAEILKAMFSGQSSSGTLAADLRIGFDCLRCLKLAGIHDEQQHCRLRVCHTVDSLPLPTQRVAQ